jgi:thiamine transport system substrate-binding protein
MTNEPHAHPRARRTRWLPVAMAGLLVALVGACGGNGSKGDASSSEGVTIKLVTHDSFAVSKSVLAAFTKETGITVKLVQGGDAGSVVNQAILTKGNPQGDVLFGVDNTLLTRALDAGIFEPYSSPELAHLDATYDLDPEQHRVSSVDYGDVCLNYDKAWFADHHVAVPTSLEQLTEPAYKDLLVVENPATSSPGLAFLLSTIRHFGTDGWRQWWKDLRANGVTVSDGWEDAYNTRFSGGLASQGDKPLVVSYASSPPVEVIYADPPVTDSPTGVITAGCYRQIEAAGVLDGTKHEAAAHRLVDFLLSQPFQADVATSMFVYPTRTGVALPDTFTRYAVSPADVTQLKPSAVEAHRKAWIDEWTDAVVR